MNASKLCWLGAVLSLVLLAGSLSAQPVEQENKSKEKSKNSGKAPPGQNPNRRPDGSQYPPGKGPYSNRPGEYPARPNNPNQQSSDRSNPPGQDKNNAGDNSKPAEDKSKQSPGDKVIQPSDRSKLPSQDKVAQPSDKGSQPSDKGMPQNDKTKQTGDTGKSSSPDSPKQTGDRPRQSPDRVITKAPDQPKQPAVQQPKLQTKQIANGEEKITASGQVRERMVKKSDGEHVSYIAPTGRVQKETLVKTDGSQQTKQFAPDGRVQREVIANKDGTKETVQMRYDRNGKERSTETIKIDNRGKEVSKTVVVKNTTVIVQNTTIVNNTAIVRNYDRARYGFVYRPVYVVNSPVFVSYYDPYWYCPSGVLIVHPFHFYWGWDNYAWYRCHHHYWVTYDVYPAPCYWMTDWLIAGYVADRYAASVSAEQAREEARVAREDADRARAAADRAREDAEIAEARAAQREAEARAAKAEARIAKAEAEEAKAKTLAGQPNPNSTAINAQTKEDLRKQIEQTVAEKKEFAEQTAKGNKPVPPDLSKALQDPKHIYPVSSAINVISASDQNAAGTLTEGDLLRLEPGQENLLKDADENTLVSMRVITSKGEDGEAKAGSVVSISLKQLQDFDSEFRAKLDLGLAEADKNKDQFRSGAL